MYFHNCNKKTKEKVISFFNLRGLSTESFLAMWLTQYVFLFKGPFLTKKCVGLLQGVQYGLSPVGNLINMHKIGKIASVGFNS